MKQRGRTGTRERQGEREGEDLNVGLMLETYGKSEIIYALQDIRTICYSVKRITRGGREEEAQCFIRAPRHLSQHWDIRNALSNHYWWIFDGHVRELCGRARLDSTKTIHTAKKEEIICLSTVHENLGRIRQLNIVLCWWHKTQITT